MQDSPTSSSEGKPMLSPVLHEIGTRLVDMLNQVSFLHRFPTLAGVTLACISQHLHPMRRLLKECEQARSDLGKAKSPEGCAAGKIVRDDLLWAAFDYAATGYQTYLECLAESAESAPAGTSPDEIASLKRLCDAQTASDPQEVLKLKVVIEAHSEPAAKEAARRFKPMEDLEWQKLRIDLFYFLLDLDKAAQDNA